MIEQRIVELLAADTNIVRSVGDRIAPVVLRQETGLPSLVYRRLDGAPEYTLAGRAGWRTITMQVACWASEYAHARALAEWVRDALDAYSEVSGVGSLRFVSVGDGADDYNAELDCYAAVCVLTVEYDDEQETL
jgi:hypothetical protein